MREKFFKMSEIAQEVAGKLDEQLGDCKDLARKGMLVGDMRGYVIRTAVNTLDNWPTKLKSTVRNEVLDWFQSEYGICL